MVRVVGAVGCVKVLQLKPIIVSIGAISKAGQKAPGLSEDFICLLPLEALPPAQEAPVVEHVRGVRVQGPVVAFSRITWLSWDFDEAVVQGKIVADGVLPRREFLSVVRESVADELTDLTECETLLGALQDGHGDQGDVGVGRLHQGIFPGFIPDHGPDFRAHLVRRAVGAAEPGRRDSLHGVLQVIIVRVIVQVEIVVNVLQVFAYRHVTSDHIDVHIIGQCRAVGHIRP